MVWPSAGELPDSKSTAPCSSPMNRYAAPCGAPRSGIGVPESVAKALVPALTITRPLRLAATTLAATKSDGENGLPSGVKGSFA